MKRLVSIILAVVMAFSLCACGAKKDESNENMIADSTTQQPGGSEQVTTDKEIDETNNAEKNSVEDENGKADSISDEEKQLQEDMDELSKIGDVEVESGILTVSITLPAEFAEGVTQEQLDAGKGTSYQSAVLNEDGTVTYKMTKKQHKEMLKGLSDSFDESFNKMIDDENYSISGITHNDDFTVFDVTLEGTEVGFNDTLSIMTFYISGGMYGIFNGSNTDHIIVNFLDPDGNLIESYDSANMDS